MSSKPLQTFNATELQSRTAKVIETRSALDSARTANASAQDSAKATASAETSATAAARDAVKSLKDYLTTLDDLGEEPDAPPPDVVVPDVVDPGVEEPAVDEPAVDDTTTDDGGGEVEEPAPDEV